MLLYLQFTQSLLRMTYIRQIIYDIIDNAAYRVVFLASYLQFASWTGTFLNVRAKLQNNQYLKIAFNK